MTNKVLEKTVSRERKEQTLEENVPQDLKWDSVGRDCLTRFLMDK